MQLLTNILAFFSRLLLPVLNIGGVMAIGAGIWLLPWDISYRLIILGIFSLLAWHSLSTK